MISTTVSKDKLFRDFKKLESKLKTEQDEKKALQIKRSKLEKKILEIKKGAGNDAFNNLIQEKDIEIQNLKKQLKLRHEEHIQTVELKTILQEKEVLQTELQNTKAIVGTIKNQKNTLEDQVELLKEKVDHLSVTDPSLTLETILGNLSVKELELRKVQEELQKEKQDILDKDKLLAESSGNKENLKRQVDAIRQALMDAKCLLWDHITKEIKKLKDHFIMPQDEKTLVTTCLSNVALVQESMGDKPVQAQRAINFLNSQSKTQLQFAGIQDRVDHIVQAKKYIVKDSLEREVALKENFLKGRTDEFKNMFKNVFNQGLPSFWDEEGTIITENEQLSKLQEKKNDTSSIDKLDPIIKGHDNFEVLDREFFLFYEIKKIIAGLPSPSYNFYSDLDVVNRDLLAAAFLANSVWQRIEQFSNKWTPSES